VSPLCDVVSSFLCHTHTMLLVGYQNGSSFDWGMAAHPRRFHCILVPNKLQIMYLQKKLARTNFKKYFDMAYSLPIQYTYRVSQEECVRLRENVPYVKLYRYNPKHLYPKLNGYGDNGQRCLKLWQLLLTYWLPNTYWNWQEYVVSVMLISVLNIKVTFEWHKAIKLN